MIQTIVKNGLALVLMWVCCAASAAISRDPIGVNVSAASAMSLTVRFADTDGAQFTTTQALFCFRVLANGQCDPTAILGRLPRSQDRGSTTVPTSSITDVMTIPYSVIRSAVVIAQQVDFSDFYYIRRFTPAPGQNLGAGVDVDVFQRVTCHLAGPATIPLSLTRVELYGEEPDADRPVKLIRLDANNTGASRVMARIEHTGTGILEGWWEVRRPGDPRLQEIDLLPEAALPEAQRGLQQRFTRLARFRVQATANGVVLLKGPRYDQLPADIAGRHEILLRLDATPGRENRSRLPVEGESLNLFSGGVAGFRIAPLEYQAPATVKSKAPTGSLAGRLVEDQDAQGSLLWRLVWRPQRDSGLVVEFTVGHSDSALSVLAPAAAGYLDLPAAWSARLPAADMTIALRGPDGVRITDLENVVSYAR